MGDWMTVMIEGTCDKSEVEALRRYLDCRRNYENFSALSNTGGLCGLGDWAAENINAVGNCAERDYTAECVREHLEAIRTIAPSLRVLVHCGGPYESKDVVATVVLNADGATIGKPQREILPDISPDAMKGRLFDALTRKQP